MSIRTLVVVLSLAVWASQSGAENHAPSLRVPDPEEIYEAYLNGFIDYQDYCELLEISRSEFITAADSVFLLQFPDLLTGFSVTPLLDDDERESMIPRPGQAAEVVRRRQSVLVRQYRRLRHDSQKKQVYRIHGGLNRITYHGEYEMGYSGSQWWGRRSIEYASAARRFRVVAGSYKERIGLGVMYGYHGRLLGKTAGEDDLEKLLFPAYGGSNGFLITAERPDRTIRLLLDTDRNGSFAKELAVASVSFAAPFRTLQVSGGQGRLRRRDSHDHVSTSLVSLFGAVTGRDLDAAGELVIAEYHGRVPGAAAAEFSLRRRDVFLAASAWTYDDDFPSVFSGGPSSRRTRTVTIDDIGLSVSDRSRGETGAVVRSSYQVERSSTLRSALAYAWRGFDDDRLEARVGLKQELAAGYLAEFDCYWRQDHLYSGRRNQRRVQIELIRHVGDIGTRLVTGHCYDTDLHRDDYMVLVENRIADRWGAFSWLCKLDYLEPRSLSNRYLYMTATYETGLTAGLRSYAGYSHRYRRGDPAGTYGTIRWELKWTVP